MAYGPTAVARHEGLVLFVRGAVPGERAEVEIRERRRNHAFADVVRIDRPSSLRRQPACPIVDRCGGCPWQHLSYPAQLQAKRKIVVDQLARIAGVELDVAPVLPSPRVYGYRRRINLRVVDGRVGFYSGGTHDLVEVDHCALAESAIDAGIAAARRLATRLSSRLRRLEIVANHKVEARLVLAGEVEGAWRESDEDVCRRWLEENRGCVGLALQGKHWQRRWGDVDVALRPEPELALAVDSTGFSQVNVATNELLVGVVLRMAGAVDGKSVLDAYAGAGNFSAPLARRGARVLAVEQSAASCRGAEQNAVALGGKWQVVHQRVEDAVERLVNQRIRVDLAVLDPPRSGAGGILPAILALRPREVVYVSCDPATLARDIARLKSLYRVLEVQPVDMFPHTYHVETVVHCALG